MELSFVIHIGEQLFRALSNDGSRQVVVRTEPSSWLDRSHLATHQGKAEKYVNACRNAGLTCV